MSKEVSARCGIGKSCEHYDPNNAVSACKIYQDRKECSKSMKARKRVANTSNKKNQRRGGYNYNRPSWPQELGAEWDDYCWSADDF